MSFAALFGGGPTLVPSPLHTFETDSPAEPEAPPENPEQVARRVPDTFVDMNGLNVPTTDTVNRWAKALVAHYNVSIRQITSVGHPTNLYGCWVFEKYRASENSGGYERLRYADATQMQEVWQAHTSGESLRFWELVDGVDGDGRPLPGPYREGRPPVNAKGDPLEEQPSRGDYGPLPDECQWIENHDQTFVEYMGTDVNWPNGCWQVEKAGCETQYLDLAGIKYVAHDILGMPHSTAAPQQDGGPQTNVHKWELVRVAKRVGRIKRGSVAAQEQVAHANGNGFASLFAENVEEAQPTTGFASLFV